MNRRGDVVIVEIPSTDIARAKKRPAVIVLRREQSNGGEKAT